MINFTLLAVDLVPVEFRRSDFYVPTTVDSSLRITIISKKLIIGSYSRQTERLCYDNFF